MLARARLTAFLRHRWLTLFASSVAVQAALSAANFIVGLLLIRYTNDAQYGYYILGFNAILLLTSLQNSLIGTPYVIALPELNPNQRRQWLGSLLRDQNRWVLWASTFSVFLIIIYGVVSASPITQLVLLLAVLIAISLSLYREFFRNTLLIYQNPTLVLRLDLLYIALLITGCLIAIQYPSRAAIIVLVVIGLASFVCARLLQQKMRDLIDPLAPSGKLRQIAPIGLWAASGAGVYWLFNQGYGYVTAYTLDITVVGALAAARLLLMPVNLITTGIQKQLIPMASNWLHRFDDTKVLQRLVLVAIVQAAGVFLFGGVIWWLRDPIYIHVLQKSPEQASAFLLMWTIIFAVKALRDPISVLLTLRKRFRWLTGSSSICALVSLGLCFYLTLHIGAMGALWGVLVGETLSLVLISAYLLLPPRLTKAR